MTNTDFPGWTLKTTTTLVMAGGDFNADDLAKVNTAKTNNGLLDSHITWTLIDGEYQPPTSDRTEMASRWAPNSAQS